VRTLAADRVVYAFSREPAPALEVAPGERFRLVTRDCYGDTLRSSEDLYDPRAAPGANPATGPVFVRGARPGDLLRVDIEAIDPRDFAVMYVQHGVSPLGDRIEGAETVVLPIRDGRMRLREGLDLTVNPMIGVIGVAPAGEPVPTVTPGEHGGNLDCKHITAGASVYLPVAGEAGFG